MNKVLERNLTGPDIPLKLIWLQGLDGQEFLGQMLFSITLVSVVSIPSKFSHLPVMCGLKSMLLNEKNSVLDCTELGEWHRTLNRYCPS